MGIGENGHSGRFVAGVVIVENPEQNNGRRQLESEPAMLGFEKQFRTGISRGRREFVVADAATLLAQAVKLTPHDGQGLFKGALLFSALLRHAPALVVTLLLDSVPHLHMAFGGWRRIGRKATAPQETSTNLVERPFLVLHQTLHAIVAQAPLLLQLAFAITLGLLPELFNRRAVCFLQLTKRGILFVQQP